MPAQPVEQPRWRRAGSPYLLTRDELVAELRRRGSATTTRQIQFWVSCGIVPLPARGVAPLAPDRRRRALYPAYLLPVIEHLSNAADHDRSLAQLREEAPALIAKWRADLGDGPPPGMAQVREVSVAMPHSTTATADTSSPLGTPRLPRALRRTVWDYAASLAGERGQAVGAVTLLVRTRDGEQHAVPVPAPAPRGARSAKSSQ